MTNNYHVFAGNPLDRGEAERRDGIQASDPFQRPVADLGRRDLAARLMHGPQTNRFGDAFEIALRDGPLDKRDPDPCQQFFELERGFGVFNCA